MSDPMRLPDDVLWQGDGHLSSTALSVVADGETSLLSPDALAHLEACADCTTRLGEGALLSVSTGKALAAVAREAVDLAAAPRVTPISSRPPARRPMPLLAMAAALLVALAAALYPGAASPGLGADQLAHSATRGLPIAAKAAVSLGRAAEPWLLQGWLPWAATALMLVAGLLVARAGTMRLRSGQTPSPERSS